MFIWLKMQSLRVGVTRQRRNSVERGAVRVLRIPTQYLHLLFVTRQLCLCLACTCSAAMSPLRGSSVAVGDTCRPAT